MNNPKVFISHASRNFRAADDLRSRLEELGIGCWIAPRNIPAGSSYGEEITGAIQNAVAVVLILTEEANASRGVASELELAFRYQRVIIPVRLKPVEPASRLAFFVNNTQWVDACQTPLKYRVHEIARILKAVSVGSRPPLPSPEQWTFLGAVERRIESLIRYKFLTLTIAFALFAAVGGTLLLKSGKTLSRVENIEAQFETLRLSATIVANPSRPEEYYSNAIQYEMRGDLSNARNSYQRYFETGSQFVDPIENFVRLLNAAEGRAGAVETLKLLNRKRPSSLLEAYIFSLEPPAQAAKLLASLVQKNPEIGPIQFLLARQFSEVRLGRQSLDDQKHERDALQGFLASQKKGEVAKFFIDKRMASDWLASAEVALRKLEGIESIGASLEISPSSSGWQLELHANEPVRRIFYRLSPDQALVDLGQLREIDADTREPIARTFVELSRRVNLGSIEFFYDDLSRVRRGPVKLAPKLTDPITATATWQREVLETTKTDWVGFRSDMPIVHFTHLTTFRCAIREAHWGWGDKLNRTLKLPPCDVNEPFGVPLNDSDSVRFNPLSIPAKRISVQLDYFDGTRSETVSFEIASAFLKTLQNEAHDSMRVDQENAKEAARFDRFYRSVGIFLGAYEVARRSDDPYWNATRLESLSHCLPPITFTDRSRYDRLTNEGKEVGEKQARSQQSPELLAQLLSRSCEDARAVQGPTRP